MTTSDSSIDPAAELDGLPVILAKNRGSRNAPPNLIVVHTMESPEKTGAARGSATWHASGNTIGSAHVHVDDKETIRGVPDDQRANGAAGANSQGLHVEIAGQAGQSAADWHDAFSQAALERAAHVVAAWCVRFSIPAKKVESADIRSGKSGITGHVNVSEAYGQSTHWDPGPNFPWDEFLARVNQLIQGDGLDMTADELRQIIREEVRAELTRAAFDNPKGPDGVLMAAMKTAVAKTLATRLSPDVLKPRGE